MKFTRMHAAALFAMAIGGAILTHQLSGSSSSAPAAGNAQDASTVALLRVSDWRGEVDTRKLATEVESLRAEVEGLRGLVAELRNDARTPDEDVLPNEEEQQEIWDEYVSEAEAGFNDERTDERWATELSATIYREIANQPTLRGKAKTVECRSKSCKIELSDDGSAGFASEVPQLVDELGAKVSSVIFDVEHDAAGRRTQVLYLSRAEPTEPSARAL